MAQRRRRSFAERPAMDIPDQTAEADAPSTDGKQDRTDRDLDALLEPVLARKRQVIKEIAIDALDPSPFQARQEFDPVEHAQLVKSMQQHGFFGVISARRHPDAPQRYQIVYGERRWRAAKDAGLDTILTQIGSYDDLAMMDIGLIENIHRADLHPLDMGRGLQLRREVENLSIRQLADHLGISKSFVENHLAAIQLPDDVQAMVRQRTDTLRAAREIGKLPTAELRAPLIAGVIAGELSKAEVTRRVQALLVPPPTPVTTPNANHPVPTPTRNQEQHVIQDTESDDLGWLDDEEPVDDANDEYQSAPSVGRVVASQPTFEPSSDTSLLLKWQTECAKIERAIVHWRTQLAMNQDEALRARVRADVEGLQVMLQQMYDMVSAEPHIDDQH